MKEKANKHRNKKESEWRNEKKKRTNRKQKVCAFSYEGVNTKENKQ